jgi:hypothetical protein
VQVAATITYQNSQSQTVGQDIINVQSDLDAPEPATILTGAFAFAIIGFAMRRRRVA